MRLVQFDAIVGDFFRRRLALHLRSVAAQREIVGERDVLAHGAAEQLVERLVPRLAAQIPQRHLDGAEGHDAGAVVDRLHAGPVGQADILGAGDVEGVAADQALRPEHR